MSDQQYPQEPDAEPQPTQQPYSAQAPYPGQATPPQPYAGGPTYGPAQYGQQPYPGQPYAPQPYPPAQYGQQPYPPVLVDPALVTALPVEERSHPFFFRTPAWRWWKPIVAALVTALIATVLLTVPPLIGMVLDGTDFSEIANTGELVLGPWGFLGNNVGLALAIPLAMLMQWAFFGQRPKWLSSVQGGFRWRWFGRCVAAVAPIWLVILGIEYALTGLPPDIHVRPYTVLLVIGILLTTPLQSAGEEYLMRGLEQRLVASYFKVETVGWVVATIVSSLTFMVLHGAADPWLNVFYFTFGAIASWLTWRTGGLEASVAIHVVNNVLSEAFMPWTDFSGMFDRSAGSADASVLINVGVLVIAGGLLTWLARRGRVVARTAPGAEDVARAQAAALSAWGAFPGYRSP